MVRSAPLEDKEVLDVGELEGTQETFIKSMEAVEVITQSLMCNATTAEKEELNEEWEVQDILGGRIRAGQKEYLILWKGYDISEATWEPADACEHADAIIVKYHKEKGWLCDHNRVCCVLE